MTAVLNLPSATQTRPGDAQPTASPTAAAANAAAASFAALTENLSYLDAASIEQVRQAYRFADEAHLGQLRNSGEPYITHPIAVAAQCATAMGWVIYGSPLLRSWPRWASSAKR